MSMTGTDDMIEHDEESDEAPASLKSRVIGLAVTVVIMAVLILGYLHFSLKPVASSQAAPKGHYAGPCWACHMISGSPEAAK
jgi:hypothetical protein